MIRKSTVTSRRLGLRLFSHARAVLAVSALAALAVTNRAAAQPTQTLTILGGSGNVGNVAANVEYYNPATGNWQPTYLTGGHPWGVVSGTNSWINYKASNASDSGISNVRLNPTWYLYRVRFTVPSDAQNPQMTFSLKADNWAQVAINGVSTAPATATPPWAAVMDHGVPIGLAIEGEANQFNSDAVFSQNVHTGENTITINMGDWGGLNGFNFRIDISMQSSQPLGIVAAGAPTTEDSAPVISVPANITVNATSAAGAPVTFSASATSNESVEIFRRNTATAEQWQSYSTTFTSGVTGNFTLNYKVVSATGGDNSIFIDAVKVTSGASTLLVDGFETPSLANSSGVFADTGNTTLPVTLGSNWSFTNYGGIMKGPSAPNWGSIANGTPPEGSQHAVLRDVISKQSKMTSTGQISLVAGQTYTVSFQQASREVFGGTLTYTVTLERSISVPVTATPASGSTFPIGTTTVNLSATTNGGTTTGSFNVTVKTIPVTITLGDLTQTYDGSVKSASATTSISGVPVNLSYIGAQLPPINAASYGVFASVSLPYTGTTSGTLKINKADATISVAGYTGTYDAAAHGATGSATGVGGVDLSAGLNLGATFTNAPGGTANWTFSGGTNYNDANGTAAIAIAKANATVTVNGYTGTYDAAAHGATGSATGVGGADLSSGLTLGATFTNAPGGTASWSFAGGTNYNDASGTAAIVINKATATVAVTGYTGTFDAAAHGATGTATGVGGVDLSSGLTLSATFTNVPGGTANWSFAGGTNYNDASGSAAIVITKANATVSVNGYTGIYDGAAHGATGSATGVGGVNLSAGLNLGSSFTNAPGGTANWTFSGGTNYNNVNGSAAITINKANATVVVTPYNVEYDGLPHSATVTSIAGVNGETGATVGTVTLNTTHTNVGTYSDSWSFAGATNYNNIASTAITDVIKDTTAPVIASVTPSTATLWPPNHQMVAITVNAVATDLVGVVSRKIISVTSSEPDNGLGDGDTAGDIVITGDLTLNLRAERDGKGTGRIYTITVEAKDAAGNASTKTCTVSVPKSQGGK